VIILQKENKKTVVILAIKKVKMKNGEEFEHFVKRVRKDVAESLDTERISLSIL
jgi:hypothetical protein